MYVMSWLPMGVMNELPVLNKKEITNVGKIERASLLSRAGAVSYGVRHNRGSETVIR